jgi:hypothetical protein
MMLRKMYLFVHKLQAFFCIQCVSVPLMSTILWAESKIQGKLQSEHNCWFGQMQMLNNDTHYINLPNQIQTGVKRHRQIQQLILL